jgi:hypothetical protein
MRGTVVSTTLVLLAIAAPTVSHAAPSTPSTLRATPAQVRAGDAITVEGEFCPIGLTVTSAMMQTMPAWFPKGTPPFVPVDLASIDLAQSPTGVSFRVTAAEARTSLTFHLRCSDGSAAESTEPVFVFPPYGEFWWIFNSFGQFVATPGFPFFFAMRSMDCEPGTPSSASLTPPGATPLAITASGTVAGDGVVAFDIDLPRELEAGTYTGTITCRTAQGDVLTNDVPVTVQSEFPVAGNSGAAMVLAAAALLVAAGVGLMIAGRRSNRSRGGHPPAAE